MDEHSKKFYRIQNIVNILLFDKFIIKCKLLFYDKLGVLSID